MCLKNDIVLRLLRESVGICCDWPLVYSVTMIIETRLLSSALALSDSEQSVAETVMSFEEHGTRA